MYKKTHKRAIDIFCSLSSSSLSRKKEWKKRSVSPWKNRRLGQLNKLSEFLHEHFVYSKCEKFRFFSLYFLVTFALFLFERWFRLYLHSYSPPIKVFVLVSHSLVASSWACTHIHIQTHAHTAYWRMRHGCARRRWTWVFRCQVYVLVLCCVGS